MSPQPLQLIIYHSPLFAAHWALFLPSSNDAYYRLGTRIHADGSPASGFEVLFEDEYKLGECTQSYEIIDLGTLIGEEGTESGRKGLERVVRSVEAPGKSLVAVDVREGLGQRQRVQLKNCQTWLANVVGKLVQEGSLEAVSRAPKN